ncbi:uncharacterized protein MELLADRAFT_65349 [Melampsora larici-populina 98AG31]|uniref:Uncharacterized protein n=1 Tax=Melampsora larici-populina (strain 98AG31 / pathotype 3-4-7) TaxID=747676 RepID=F4RV03_MELLP|nr:uncharacterized protein MELLADRAFT_65349 [Melampsora larici-populina 98AG31]EGG03788.1 hypothetical protein MELLADRAFT_65349 [Melampsora larici-populina 98AG31]
MQLDIAHRLPMRWSSIFWIGNEVGIPSCSRVARRYFQSNAIYHHQRGLAHTKLLIAEEVPKPLLKPMRAYRLEGPIITGLERQESVLLVNPDHTIAFDEAQIRCYELANKVSVTGVGRIINTARIGGPHNEFYGEMVTVLHRDWDPTTLRWVEFIATYQCDLHIVVWLDMDVLKVGNVVQFSGNIIGTSANVWVVKVTNILPFGSP